MDYFNSSFIEDLNQSIDINHGEDSQRKNTKEHEKNVKGVCEPRLNLENLLPLDDKSK